MADISVLAAQQLAAYNEANLEAFVACYHEDVRVLDQDEETLRGREAMRERYRELFEEWTFGAEVSQRVHVGKNCVDYERWWRVEPGTGERAEGFLLVRYTEREGLIGLVQFLD
jgi:hypothetical protein